MKFNQIDKNYIIWLGVFAVVGGFFAYYFGSRTGKANATAAATDTLTSEIKSEPLTFELAQYETFAQKIYYAVFDFGTDEEAVYNVFSQLRTKSDVLQLIKTFGTRNILPGINDFTLPEWLYNDLTPSEIQHVNDILARNNINYIF